MSCPPSPGRTPTARATSATWPVSVCPPTCSAATCGWPGHDVLMVSGTDEHGTPILVAADEEGVTARELADKNNAVIVAGPRRPRAVLRPVHPHHDRQPLPRGAGDVPHRAPQRLHGRADHAGRDQPVDRPHPAGPLHRGHLPDLRVRRRARRPVRQLRQPARPDRPDQPALEDQRRDAGVRRDPALLPRPAGAGRRAGGVARRARGVRHLAAQRHQVLARTSSRTSGRGR